MYFKLVACEVFHRMVCYCVARSPHIFDIEFTDKGAHDKSDCLRNILQSKIDEASNRERNYDAILLGLGLCGNSTLDLVSRGTKVVIPRAHDCCTFFLGSKEKFKKHFGDNPSQPFTSAGYMERGDGYFRDTEMGDELGINKTYEEYEKLYGEENAKYLYDTFQESIKKSSGNRIVYIEVPETSHLGFAQKCREQAEADGKELIMLEGSIRLLKKLTFGEWNDDEFLVLGPNQKIAGIYDMDEIIKAEDIDE